MAHDLLTAVDEGNLAAEEVPPLLIDYGLFPPREACTEAKRISR